MSLVDILSVLNHQFVAAPIQIVSFWLSIALPELYVPLLFEGLRGSIFTVFAGLVTPTYSRSFSDETIGSKRRDRRRPQVAQFRRHLPARVEESDRATGVPSLPADEVVVDSVVRRRFLRRYPVSNPRELESRERRAGFDLHQSA